MKTYNCQYCSEKEPSKMTNSILCKECYNRLYNRNKYKRKKTISKKDINLFKYDCIIEKKGVLYIRDRQSRKVYEYERLYAKRKEIIDEWDNSQIGGYQSEISEMELLLANYKKENGYTRKKS